jgi:hypothetical protein
MQYEMSAKGQKRTLPPTRSLRRRGGRSEGVDGRFGPEADILIQSFEQLKPQSAERAP